MLTLNEKLKNILLESFPDAMIDIKDRYNDGQHLHIYIKTSIFNSKSLLEQHKLVYNSLKGIVGETIHAISLKTEEAL